MKITFLGTGPAINIPRKGCRCPTCQDARKPGSKSKRTNSSVLIQNKGTSILIDCTPNFKNQITTELRKNRNYENFKIDAVFLTHAHKDASGGLRDLIKWLGKNKMQATLYAHKETLKKLTPTFSPCFHPVEIGGVRGGSSSPCSPDFIGGIGGVRGGSFSPCFHPVEIGGVRGGLKFKNLSIKIIKPYKLINLKTCKLISFPVRHGLKKYPTFGYLIEEIPPPPTSPSRREGEARWGRVSILYASDMDGAPKKSLKYFKKTGILILDASMWFGKKIKGHFNVEEAIEFARNSTTELRKKTKLRKLYLTHIGHTFPPHQKAQKEINKYLKKGKIPLKVKIAFDEMTL